MRRKGNIWAVISPKGGVGKTVTSSNLALALSLLHNKKILAVDTNVTTASLGFHFNLIYPKVSIYDVIKNKFNVNEAIHKHNENLHIIPASIVIEKADQNIDTMQKNIKKIVGHYEGILSELVDRYDFIILDAAGGFSTESMASMKVADSILLVTNPEYPSILATAKCIEYARHLKVPIAGLILTKVMGKSYELSKEDIEKALKIKVLGQVPFDENVPRGICNKQPVIDFKPYSGASFAYKTIASTMVGKTYDPKFREKIRHFFGV